MECLPADAGTEIGAKPHPVQTRQRLLCPVPVKFHTICMTVIPTSQCMQGKPASAAWIKQVDKDPFRKSDAPGQESDVFQIGRVISHFYIRHQTPDHRGTGGICGIGSIRSGCIRKRQF